VLIRYEVGTCQLISPSKCSIMFRAECSDANKVMVQKVLDVANVALEERYLGLPTPDGRMSKERFKSTKERLAKKLSSWEERYMSGGQRSLDQVGSSIYSDLCDGVLQATYYVVRGTHTDDTLLRYFWWGEDNEHRKVH
jgi:hypothetical protein